MVGADGTKILKIGLLEWLKQAFFQGKSTSNDVVTKEFLLLCKKVVRQRPGWPPAAEAPAITPIFIY